MVKLTKRVDHPNCKKTVFSFGDCLFLQNNNVYWGHQNPDIFTAFQTCLSLFVCCCWEQCAPCLLFFSPWMCIKSPHVFPKKLYVFLQESICMSSEPGARSRSLANFSLDRALAISSSTPFLFVIIVIAIVIDIMIETIIFISHIIASDVHNVIIVFQCKAQ